MNYKTSTFYRYITLDDPANFVQKIREVCQANALFGRILIAEEGINGGVSGRIKDVEFFKEYIESIPELQGMTYRDQEVEQPGYVKLVVRKRDEVVAFGQDVALQERGEHISPTELKKKLDDGEKVLLLDARNAYEAEVGTFVGAKVLPIQTFREFPKVVDRVFDTEDKEKEIVMFCTGGIRCEKSSAYLRAQGFKNVKQLEGGIINYINQYPDTYFKGDCFVFDERRVSEVSTEGAGACRHCRRSAREMINCSNIDCDRLFTCCPRCQITYEKCCGSACMRALKKRSHEMKRPIKSVGKVLNYYSKKKIVHISVSDYRIEEDDMLIIKGKTTQIVQQMVKELRDDKGQPVKQVVSCQDVTLPCDVKVRENDRVYVVV